MAKQGSVSLTGPAVASVAVGRGRSSLGVIRVGGAESGRVASFSLQDTKTADNRSASLNSFLKNFIPVVRVDQIDFKPQIKQGFETVKPLGESNNQIPVPEKAPEVVPVEAKHEVNLDTPKPNAISGTIDFSSNIQPLPELKAETKLKIPKIIEGKVVLGKSEPITSIDVKRITKPSSLIGFASDANSRAAELIQIMVQKKIKANRQVRARTILGVVEAPVLQQSEHEAVTGPLAAAKPEIAIKTAVGVNIQNTFQEKKTAGINKRVVSAVRKGNVEQFLKKKYAKRDWEMDQQRLKLLNDNYEAIRVENAGTEVDGGQVARRSLVGSLRGVRSIFLDQRGYYDREDGTQRKIELLLESVKSIDKGKLKEIVNGSNALKEDEDPNNTATQKQVDEVINRPDILKRDFEPVEIVSETILERKNTEVGKVEAPTEVDLVPASAREAVQLDVDTSDKKIESGGLPSRFLDTIADNIGLTLDNSLDIIGRRERDFLYE